MDATFFIARANLRSLSSTTAALAAAMKRTDWPVTGLLHFAFNGITLTRYGSQPGNWLLRALHYDAFVTD